MSRWTLGRRIALGYAILLVLLSVVAGIGMYTLSSVGDRYRDAVEKERDVQLALEASKAFSDASRELRGFLLTEDESFLALRDEDIAAARAGLTRLRATATTDVAAGWEDVLQTIEAWDEAVQPVIRAKRAGRDEQALRLNNENAVPHAVKENAVVRTLIEAEQRGAAEIARSASDRASNALWLMLAVAAVALATGIAIALVLARSITGRLRQTISSLAASSSQILAATSQQAAGVLEEETAVQETSATVDEVKQTVRVSTEKADAVAESVRRTAEISEEGRQAVDESIRGAQQAKARMEAIAERILALSERAQAIGEITASVNDVAEQSNLLAVNAGIEAAKAGEAGRGFAVVAAEVRTLAERSKQAASEIRRILTEIQQATQSAVLATEQGVKASEAGEVVAGKAGQAIHVLADNLSESAQAAQQILASSQQQMVGMDQVALAMQNIQEAAAQNMAATRQVEQAAQDLNELARSLTELVAAERQRGDGRVGA